MILFIQTFRFAAEPFFFSQEKQHNSRKIYADVLKYFTILASLIFLAAYNLAKILFEALSSKDPINLLTIVYIII